MCHTAAVTHSLKPVYFPTCSPSLPLPHARTSRWKRRRRRPTLLRKSGRITSERRWVPCHLLYRLALRGHDVLPSLPSPLVFSLAYDRRPLNWLNPFRLAHVIRLCRPDVFAIFLVAGVDHLSLYFAPRTLAGLKRFSFYFLFYRSHPPPQYRRAEDTTFSDDKGRSWGVSRLTSGMSRLCTVSFPSLSSQLTPLTSQQTRKRSTTRTDSLHA